MKIWRSVFGIIKKAFNGLFQTQVRGLRVFVKKDKIYLLFESKSLFSNQFKIARSNDAFDFSLWKTNRKVKLNEKPEKWVFENKEGLLSLEYIKNQIKICLLSKENINEVLWEPKEAIWTANEAWQKNETEIIGIINFKGKIVAYFNVESIGIFAVLCCHIDSIDGVKIKSGFAKLEKHQNNPILTPGENHWESVAVFNPGILYEDGKIHIVYRAMGYSSTSVFGYAVSSDGVNIDERHPEPIYRPRAPFESPNGIPTKYAKYMSGGGYGGCEDPRLVKIDDRIYLTYVAYNGMGPPRVALSSISVDNFLNRRWLWETPVLISPPGVVDKNACLLPEKINNQFVIFHRIFPNILIDFVDDLNFNGENWLKGEFLISPREKMWDSRKIGIGAPPIKTDDGWLLIYQAVGNQDDSKYKIGAMLLDLNNPTKVLYRSNSPILEPNEDYENNGHKFGVVYPCGAAIIGEDLYVYYGGSDKVVCVAKTNLQKFLNELKFGNVAHGEKIVKKIF